jgi:hypothetical protein
LVAFRIAGAPSVGAGFLDLQAQTLRVEEFAVD